MDCRDCARFDPELARCRDGKLNPSTWDETVTVANIHGMRSICVFCDHRERMIASRVGTPMQRGPRVRRNLYGG